MLLDGSLRQSRNADAVATHPERFGLAVLVGETALHGLGIFSAQLKNVADFDASFFRQA